MGKKVKPPAVGVVAGREHRRLHWRCQHSSVVNGEMKFRNKCQLPLLSARLRSGVAGECSDQRLVISKKSERTTFEEIAIVEE